MNILIAPDSFKGSITATQFCDISEKAIKSVLPDTNVIKCPLADGGEGTIEAMVLNTKGVIKEAVVTGPLGKKIISKYGILGDGKTAIIEMASASGLPLVSLENRNPLVTTTYGTGELVLKALDEGCTKIIMGIGGSATNDGGAGMMEALGFKLLDKNSNSICSGAKGLLELDHIDTSNSDDRLENVSFIVACDVNNPLYGPNGASYVYGPQKGATKEMLPILDNALINFSNIIQKDLGKDVSNVKGAGAAGGLGAGIMAFLNGELKSGVDIIKDAIKLDEIIKNEKIDLVITGEGEVNFQTANGKLPVGVSREAKKYDIPVFLLVGSIGEGSEKVYDMGIDSIISIMDKPMNLDIAIKRSEELLYQTVSNLMRVISKVRN